MIFFQMLVSDESDYFDLYSEAEQDELLFRLFKHLCLGGSVCQYEDTVEPYLQATKLIYKDLVRYVWRCNDKTIPFELLFHMNAPHDIYQ